MLRLGLWIVVLLAALSCGDNGGGNSTTDPTPDLTRIRWMGGQESEQGPIDIVGLEQATAGAGKVAVVAPFEDKSVNATAAGSFFITIPAQKGEVIELRYKESASVKLQVPLFIDVSPGPNLSSGEPPITTPANGKTTIVGTGVANQPLTVANVTTGQVVASKVTSDGTFNVVIDATTGDRIRAYVDENPMGPPWELLVP